MCIRDRRWGASSVIVIGIAGVVGVLVAMLAMGEGFKATLDQTGDDSTAILLRAGSQAETNSVITRDQTPLIAAPVSYTHLDVYKRQGWWIVEPSSGSSADRVAKAIDTLSANSDHETKTQSCLLYTSRCV